MISDRVDRTDQVIGQRFRIDAMIGRGAMAEVYRAVDQTTQSLVALKILKKNLSGEPAAKLRFTREGDVQAKLRHRNIAALYATGLTD